jgi:hypothetical protein
MQGVWVFASATARDAAVTSPQEGNFAYLKDTNVTTYYTGSAWANLDTTGMTNPMTTTGDTIYSSSGSTPARLGIGSTGQVLTVAAGIPSWSTPAAGGGLTLITPTSTANSGGTVSTSGGVVTASGVSSVSLNGVFSATYLNYIIEYNELSGSTTLQSYMRLRASGSDNTSSTYSCGSARVAFTGGAPGGYSDSNASFWTFNVNTDTRKVGSPIFINSPFEAVATTFSTTFSGGDNGGFMAGNHSTASAFDGFTIYPSTGTISGIFRVYGISN